VGATLGRTKLEQQKAKRPAEVPGRTIKVGVGCGSIYITVGYVNGKIFEIFATLGHSGGCGYAQLEALTRSITAGLRYGVPVDEYIDQLQKIKCPSPGHSDEGAVESCSDAIAKVMQKYGAKP